MFPKQRSRYKIMASQSFLDPSLVNDQLITMWHPRALLLLIPSDKDVVCYIYDLAPWPTFHHHQPFFVPWITLTIPKLQWKCTKEYHTQNPTTLSSLSWQLRAKIWYPLEIILIPRSQQFPWIIDVTLEINGGYFTLSIHRSTVVIIPDSLSFQWLLYRCRPFLI